MRLLTLAAESFEGLMEFYLSAVDAPPGDDPTERLRGAARQIRLAREHGFSGVVVGQHLSTAGANRYPPIAYLSYLAEYADGMAIGPTTSSRTTATCASSSPDSRTRAAASSFTSTRQLS